MKRCCKNVDITDRSLIERAVNDCLNGKLTRTDAVRMFSEYTGIPVKAMRNIVKDKNMVRGIKQTITDGIRQEIIDRKYIVKPIRYRCQYDHCSKKLRKIGIQDVKQQIYDYIAVYAMEGLFKRKLMYYQTAALKKKGCDFGAKAIKKWIRNRNIRYAWKTDVRHYYESIDTYRLKRMLLRDVKNEPLLHLVFFLIDTFGSGLSIGSYLSQYLANYYMAHAYRHASTITYTRHSKRGNKTIQCSKHVLFQMDDMLVLTTSRKYASIIDKEMERYVREGLGLELKERTVTDLQTGYIDILGRKISRKSLTVRPSNFLRFRRSIVKAERIMRAGKPIPVKLARRCIGRYGAVKNSDTKRFQKRYKVEETIQSCKKTISKAERSIA